MTSPIEAPWLHLIRFVSAHDDKIHFGDAILPDGHEIGATHSQPSILKAKLIIGDPLSADCIVQHDKVVSVKKLLGPLIPQMVPSVRCIGMNYASHVAEGSIKLPEYPVMFMKPPNAVTDYGADIKIPKIAQDSQADYEGELVVIIGTECKNVAKDNAMQHVLGYTVGNDVSSRKWQLDSTLAGKWPQASFSKGFDSFAPLGPCITAARAVNPANLNLTTKVNSQPRQSGNTGSMIFDIPTLIAFLSQGTTLEAGSIIMTGTPAGVGFMMEPPQYLTDGDIVEISIEGIGTLVNRVKHAT